MHIRYGEQWVRDTVYFDKGLVGFVEESMEEMGAKWQKILSGAGHDAQFCAYMIPTTMLFARTTKTVYHTANLNTYQTKTAQLSQQQLLMQFLNATQATNSNIIKIN